MFRFFLGLVAGVAISNGAWRLVEETTTPAPTQGTLTRADVQYVCFAYRGVVNERDNLAAALALREVQIEALRRLLRPEVSEADRIPPQNLPIPVKPAKGAP